MSNIKINTLQVQEKAYGTCRGLRASVFELLAMDLGGAEDGVWIRFLFPQDIEYLEQILGNIKQPSFNNYDGLVFEINRGDRYIVDPYKANLGIIKLMKSE